MIIVRGRAPCELPTALSGNLTRAICISGKALFEMTGLGDNSRWQCFVAIQLTSNSSRAARALLPFGGEHPPISQP